jgi:hypothetical protein
MSLPSSLAREIISLHCLDLVVAPQPEKLTASWPVHVALPACVGADEGIG